MRPYLIIFAVVIELFALLMFVFGYFELEGFLLISVLASIIVFIALILNRRPSEDE